MASVSKPLLEQTDGVVSSVSSALDVLDAGKTVVGLFVKRHTDAIREQLIDDAKRGKIPAIDLYANENVGGYIFRLQAAIRQGTRTKNLRLLARYLFGEATLRGLTYDECVEDASILEGLTDGEIRSLAVYKAALDCGRLKIRTDGEEPPAEEALKYTTKDIDLRGLFANELSFSDASTALQRWGLVRPSPTWDVIGFEPTAKLARFVERLDLEGMISS